MALGIVTVALLSLMAVFISGLKLAEASDQVTTASTVGQEFLERTKAKGFDMLTLGTFDAKAGDLQAVDTGFPPSPYPSVRRENRDYTLVVECIEMTATIRSVKVDVYWDVKSSGKVTFYTRVHK